MNKNTCKYCGKEIPRTNKFCNNSCAASYNNKKRGARSEETKRKISESVRKYVIKKQKAHENKIVYRICENCGMKFEVKRNSKNRLSIAKFCSNNCRSKYLSNINKVLGSGGFREGSVKNYKSGWFNGIHCDSSWELAFLLWHRDHNIVVKRCEEVRCYVLNNIKHKYFPDFVVENKIYEIKGINDEINKAKQQYNQDIIFLYKNDIQMYIDYAKTTYGNFINCYDKKDKINISH